MVDHPFEEGKRYQNHIGRYEVVAIEGAKMLVRYEDGREQIVGIHTPGAHLGEYAASGSAGGRGNRPPVRRRGAQKEGASGLKK